MNNIKSLIVEYIAKHDDESELLNTHDEYRYSINNNESIQGELIQGRFACINCTYINMSTTGDTHYIVITEPADVMTCDDIQQERAEQESAFVCAVMLDNESLANELFILLITSLL